MKKQVITDGQAEVLAIRKKMKHFEVQKEPECWLQPKYRELSAVLGDPKRGIPYGKIYEICGKFSGGKTALVLELAAEAQMDGAEVAWMDHEISWDARWARIRGLDPDRVALFQPTVVKDGRDDL